MNQQRNCFRLAACAAWLVMLAACVTSAESVSQKMDPLTAVIATYSKSPMIIYRDTPAHAAFSRHYVSLGPIEVNKSGTHKYFLWLGIWSTLQRNDPADLQDGFDTVVLLADGEPLPLDIVGWSPAAIGTSEPVYPKPFATSLDAYYRVTVDQIRLLAGARDISLRTSGTTPLQFELWGEQSAARNDLNEFLHRVYQ